MIRKISLEEVGLEKMVMSLMGLVRNSEEKGQ